MHRRIMTIWPIYNNYLSLTHLSLDYAFNYNIQRVGLIKAGLGKVPVKLSTNQSL